MKATIHNDLIRIEDPDPSYMSSIREHLSYTDKSKQYQLRRLEKNPFSRNSAHYRKLKQEVYGTVLEELDDGSIVIPSGFANLVPNAVDMRQFNGSDVSLPWSNKPFDLRDYQKEAVDLMLPNYRGLINFATGLGKTLTAVHAIREIGKRSLIVCPGVGIADNFYEELSSAFGERKVGYVGGGKDKIRDITVGIAQSVNNRIDKFKAHDLGVVVFDEVHHIAASTFYNISSHLSNIGRMYGLTATDFRSDGKDVLITAGVGPVLIKRDLVWGVKNKWLADPYIIVREIPTTGREYREDKIKNYKEHVLNSKPMNERIIRDCADFIKAGKSVLCLVSEVEHGEMLSQALGLPFATGADKKSRSYIQQLNDGTSPGLIGTASKIGEGVDTKRVDVLVLANFPASKGPLWQNLGRGMRLYGNKKHVIVLDYKPLGSKMLSRHCDQRLKFYREITSNIKVC